VLELTQITQAPLPDFLNLFKGLFSALPGADELASPWKKGYESAFWFSRSAWSLYSIAIFRMKVLNKKRIVIWIPDFFCNESLLLLRQLSIHIRFYPIDSITTPNMIECRRLLKDDKPDLILYAHFFGEVFDASELKEIARESKAWLVEDCAHCLMPIEGVGSSGDFILYSQHKLIAIPDGALLLIRYKNLSNELDSLFLKRQFHSTYISLVKGFKNNESICLKWLLKRVLQKTGIRRKLTSVESHKSIQGQSIDKLPAPIMSNFSMKMLSFIKDKLILEGVKRKQNAIQWSRVLMESSLKGKGECSFDGSYVPYLLSCELFSPESVIEIINEFRKNDIPVSTWPDLPPEVESKLHNALKAREMRYKRIYFPVHSSIEANSIKKALQCIK